ncbi:hypothetical protein ACFQ0M_48880 [Kitasatospora aburaviensis]|uniref:FHA domain-containing protein n=1 Tax=Kitasatospora aburaviensis TaxID=67265 RepID=A0ABW1F2W4_9ACTN
MEHRPEDRVIAVEPKLTVEKFGHTLTVTGRGLAIDGRTVDPAPLTQADAVLRGQDPRESTAFQVGDDGLVVYRGRRVARIDPTGTFQRPGSVQLNPSLTVPGPRPVQDLDLADTFDLDL